MTNNDYFFQEKKPAAVLKHALLNEYFKVFASAVGSQNPSRPIWMIDAYAGAGAYQSENSLDVKEVGSPLVTLRMAENFRSRTINTILIESDEAIARQLRENVYPFTQRGLVVSVLRGDAEERLEEAWDRVGDDPVLTFLDPFGIALRQDQMIDLLLSRRPGSAPSEVLVNINVEAVWRIGGNLIEIDNRIESRPGQELGVRRADKFFGSDWWRSEFLKVRQEQKPSAEAARIVVEAYRERIKSETGYSSIAIPVRRRPDSQPIFHLTLFYRHSLGGYKFADAASRATGKWRDHYRKKELEELFSDKERPTLFGPDVLEPILDKDAKTQEAQLCQDWVEEICLNITGIQRQKIRIDADIELILGRTLGLAGEKHIRMAWDQLSKQARVKPRNRSAKRFERQTIELL